MESQPMFCRKCFYNLHALEEHRCPECGSPFDPDDPTTYFPFSPGWVHKIDPSAGPLLGAFLCIFLAFLLVFNSPRDESLVPAILVWSFGVGLALSATRGARAWPNRIVALLVFLAMLSLTIMFALSLYFAAFH